MRGWRLQGLDLRGYDDRLAGLDPAGAALLGCRTSPELADRLREGGAVVLPRIEGLPFSPYRGLLYTPDELYAGLEDGYEATFDARAYRWSLDSRVEHDALLAAAAALHDHAIDDALGEAVVGHRTVGVMGGHKLDRGTDGYRTRDRPRPTAGRPGSAGRHRRRTGRDGGGEPRRPAGRGRRGRGRRGRGAAGGGPRPRRRRDRLGARRRRGGRGPAAGDHDRRADLVLRPRAAEPLRHPRREVLRQRPARGHAAAALRRRHRVPARSGRHGAGAVPGRVRELLRRRG